VEQAHFRTKTAVEQALLLRGHADFVDEATYEAFVREVIERKRNGPAAPRLADERPYLRPLPSAPVPNYTTFTCVVRRWSTIRVGKRTYSVPSRLLGHTVEARQHPTTVDVLYRGQVIELFLREALSKSPRDYGLTQPNWTTMLLSKVIKRRYKCEVSDECIRQHLHEVDGVCRRPTWTVRHRAEVQPGYAQKKAQFQGC